MLASAATNAFAFCASLLSCWRTIICCCSSLFFTFLFVHVCVTTRILSLHINPRSAHGYLCALSIVASNNKKANSQTDIHARITKYTNAYAKIETNRSQPGVARIFSFIRFCLVFGSPASGSHIHTNTHTHKHTHTQIHTHTNTHKHTHTHTKTN